MSRTESSYIRSLPLVIALAALALACSSGAGSTVHPTAPAPAEPAAPDLRHPDEIHLAEIRQLTVDTGENAEAYWSSSGDQLIFQTTRPPYECDQIMTMPADGSAAPTLVSTGKGRTTCAYFMPGDERIIYSSTHLAGDACPPKPDYSKGYVWPIYETYDIFSARPDGSDLRRLTDSPSYDAEATVCARDGSIIFTSTRDGDLDLYRMDADGGNVVRLTDAPGYDGGAFFSPDCSKIVWRASRPQGADLERYQRNLAEGVFRPSALEIYVANADGSDARQITYLGAGSFAPYFHPSGERVLFSSNHGDPSGREFDIWAINVDGTGLHRITHTPGFDGFPMFSPDGSQLAFASNRNQANPGETDVYVARWVEAPLRVVERAPDRFMRDVRWLADEAREGRGVGTPGLEAAGDWLAAQLADIGVAPAAGDGFRQPLEVPVDVRVTAAGLTIRGAAVPDEGFAPASFSASGQVAAATVFAGYGIVAPELGRDDYRGKNVKGRIAVVRRFVPPLEAFEKDPALERRYSDLRYKAFAARERGAVGLIVVDLPEPGADEAAEAPLPGLDVSTDGDVGIPVVIVGREHGAALARGQHRARIEIGLEPLTTTVHNIVGKIAAGADDRLPGAILVGAHYDHLGMGGRSSMAPGVKAIHHGADDNASGTAGLLEVARLLIEQQGALRRDVYLVAFTAEEMGALGSSHFVRNPPDGLQLDALVAMLNMDMIGRLRGNHLAVLGGRSAAEWPELAGASCARAAILCDIDGDGYGSSDQTPFYAAGVPVLQFFSGSHEDYHKPSDRADRVNAAGGAQIALLVADLTARLADRAEPLTYHRVPAPPPAGDVRSFGASLGTIPDYTGAGDRPGVLLADVRAGGPAETAGLRRGDRLVAIGGTEIRGIQDMMFVLRRARPGDTAILTVVRDGARLKLPVTYGASVGMRGGN